MAPPAAATGRPPGTLAWLRFLGFTPEEVQERRERVRRAVLAGGEIPDPACSRLGPAALARLYASYDAEFLGGWLATLPPPRFRFSARMTRIGGRAARYRQRRGDGVVEEWFEVTISSHLLAQSFAGEQREVVVNGHPCRDRLDALMRIFEHELVHLLELWIRGTSSCRGRAFADLGRRLFDHRGTTHGLVTGSELARERFALTVGDTVEFDHEGRTLRGRLNRVTRRATVLVPAAGGRRYSDGRCYDRWYVPLPALRRVVR